MKKIMLLSVFVLSIIILPAFAIYTHSYHSLKVTVMSRWQAEIIYRIISSEGNTYGYDIIVNGKLRVHLPANHTRNAGNKGFFTKKRCRKNSHAGDNKNTKRPNAPTIEKRELDSLKIKF